ncbi:MAG: hypothetical protein J6K32_03225 [Clostridia bacterium]|nr:hypothetical protein [Clostridia bacterium]
MRKMIKTIVALGLLLALVMTAAVAFAAVQPIAGDNSLNFQYKAFHGGQTFRVYSGPGRHYWIGANGWAKALSDEEIYVAGQEGNFLLVQYGISKGVRVGYICIDDISGGASAKRLNFDYTTKTITRLCSFTDDPSSLNNPIGTLSAGDRVTYLSKYYNGLQWAYVESLIDGVPIRGFVPLDCVE